MFQKPTELLRIGCLTGLISILKLNSQTFEWNNFHHLFNIIHFNSTCFAKNSSSISCPKTMAKRMPERKGEERCVAKSKSTAMNLSSYVPTSSSSAKSTIASKSPGILTATGETLSLQKEESGDADLSESETGSEEDVTGRPVAYKTAAVKPCAPIESDCQGRPKVEKTERFHNLHVFPATIHHTEAVFSIVKEIYGREPTTPWMTWL